MVPYLVQYTVAALSLRNNVVEQSQKKGLFYILQGDKCNSIAQQVKGQNRSLARLCCESDLFQLTAQQ